jgi:hypothetical protein
VRGKLQGLQIALGRRFDDRAENPAIEKAKKIVFISHDCSTTLLIFM